MMSAPRRNTLQARNITSDPPRTTANVVPPPNGPPRSAIAKQAHAPPNGPPRPASAKQTHAPQNGPPRLSVVDDAEDHHSPHSVVRPNSKRSTHHGTVHEEQEGRRVQPRTNNMPHPTMSTSTLSQSHGTPTPTARMPMATSNPPIAPHANPQAHNSADVRLIVPYVHNFLKWASMIQRSHSMTTKLSVNSDTVRLIIVVDKFDTAQSDLIPSENGPRHWPLDTPLNAYLSIQSTYNHMHGYMQMAKYPIKVILLGSQALSSKDHAFSIVVPCYSWMRALSFLTPSKTSIYKSPAPSNASSLLTIKSDTDGRPMSTLNLPLPMDQGNVDDVNEFNAATLVDHLDLKCVRNGTSVPSAFIHMRHVSAQSTIINSTNGINITCPDWIDSANMMRIEESALFEEDWRDDFVHCPQHLVAKQCWGTQLDVHQIHPVVRLPTRRLHTMLKHMMKMLNNKGSSTAQPTTRGHTGAGGASSTSTMVAGNSLVELLYQSRLVPYDPRHIPGDASRSRNVGSHASTTPVLCLETSLTIHLDTSNFVGIDHESLHVVETFEPTVIPVSHIVQAWRMDDPSLDESTMMRRMERLCAPRSAVFINIAPFTNLFEDDESNHVSLIFISIEDTSQEQHVLLAVHQQKLLNPLVLKEHTPEAGIYQNTTHDAANKTRSVLAQTDRQLRALTAEVRTMMPTVAMFTASGEISAPVPYDKRMIQIGSLRHNPTQRNEDGDVVEQFVVDRFGRLWENTITTTSTPNVKSLDEPRDQGNTIRHNHAPQSHTTDAIHESPDEFGIDWVDEDDDAWNAMEVAESMALEGRGDSPDP